ncbi:hypothetical protein EJ07DRAFT_95213 [Lizonia empirigonia]|nr:hypothetical protein EJ07DRAFT_95213 [Lizonia empirigonia]
MYQDRLTHCLCADLFRYAYYYNCSQTFCYDGMNLLILQFRASSREDIKTCQADCWVILTVSSPTTASIRYALYRLLSDGFHRSVGQANNPQVAIGNYRRYFEWFSGKPYWSDGNNTLYQLPLQGYERVFHSQSRAWAWNLNGVHYTWDTAAFTVQ